MNRYAEAQVHPEQVPPQDRLLLLSWDMVSLHQCDALARLLREEPPAVTRMLRLREKGAIDSAQFTAEILKLLP